MWETCGKFAENSLKWREYAKKYVYLPAVRKKKKRKKKQKRNKIKRPIRLLSYYFIARGHTREKGTK